MNIKDMTMLLCGSGKMESGGLPEQGVYPIRMSDGPIGLRYQRRNKDFLGINASEPATVLLSGPALAATWNPEVAETMGEIIGSEASYYDVDLILGPAVNLVRNPLCGRNAEYYSEEPLLAGKIGAGYIRGAKSTGVDCCIKHFAANNQETEREYLNVVCDEAALRELYLKAFEIAIKESCPAAVMTSLSKINGTYCSENRWLLTDVLRNEWKYDGIVMTDWMGVDNRTAAICAGLDLEMPGTNGRSADLVTKALAAGELSQEDVSARAENMVKASARLRKEHTIKPDKTELFLTNHAKVTKAAEESIVLLKNRDGILPFGKGGNIAVIGYYAQHPLFQAEGSGKVNASFSENAFGQIMQNNGDGNVSFAKGYEKNNEAGELERKRMTEEAVDAAKEADKVVLFLATDSCLEGEGKDRKQFTLPDYQISLLYAVREVNPNIVAVVMNGGAVSMPWAEDVSGILECFYGGQGIGKALAKVLFGEVNPSGHMPVSVPYMQEHIISWENFAQADEQAEYREGMFMGYRGYCTKGVPVQWPFGYGLSYTTFEVTEAACDKESMTNQEKAVLTVKVRNTGECAGAQVVQVYVKNAPAWKARPSIELRGFEKVYLEAGQETQIQFVFDAQAFACFDERIQGYSVPEGCYSLCAGFSCVDLRKTVDIQISALHPVPAKLTGWSKTERLLETEHGREIFENLLTLIEQKAQGLLGEKIPAGENLRENIMNIPLRRAHLLVWTEITDSQMIELIERFNQSLYEQYRKKIQSEDN